MLPVVLVATLAVLAWWLSSGVSLVDRARKETTEGDPATSDRQPTPTRSEEGVERTDIRGVVVDAEGRPVAGARVGAQWEERATRTDAEGRFVLAPQGRGAEEIEVYAPGFAKREVVMAAGMEMRVVLLRGAVLAGTVQRADGSAAPGALVRVGDVQTTADAEGRFRVEDIPPGICRLRARTGDYIDAPDAEYDLEFLPDEQRLGYVITIDRAKKSYLEVDLVDHAGGPLTGWTLYDPWHDITSGADGGSDGRFRLEFEGAPGEDVLLTASPPEGQEAEFLYLQTYARTHAQPGGEPIVMRVPRVVRVTFVGRLPDGAPLPAGVELRVKCLDNPSAPVDRAAGEPVGQATRLVQEGEEYSLRAGAKGYTHDDEDWTPPAGGGTVDVVLRPLGKIRGRLCAADGSPVPRAWFHPADGRRGIRELDPDGSFVVTPSELGRFRFTAGTDDRMPGMQREVDVAPGAVVDLGEVRLEPPTVLRGKAVDACGIPVGDARVTFDTDLYDYFPGEVLTDADGAFAIPAPPFAAGVLTVEAEGYGIVTLEVDDVREPLAVTVHAAARAEVFVEVDPAIAPQTYDLKVGKKLPSGAVRWRYVARPIWQSGTRRFLVGDLAPGPTLFRAVTPWDQVGLTEVDIKAGETHRVAVRVR